MFKPMYKRCFEIRGHQRVPKPMSIGTLDSPETV